MRLLKWIKILKNCSKSLIKRCFGMRTLKPKDITITTENSMTNSFRYIVATLATITILSSCSKVDDMLGLDFIPDDMQLKLKIDTLYHMDTYGAKLDSLPSTRLGIALIGHTQSQRWGEADASAIIQFAPSYFSKKDFYGEFSPTLDSVWVYLNVSGVGGDTTRVAKPILDFYKVTEKLNVDSIYYSDYNPQDKFDPNKLFSVTMQNSAKNLHRFKLTQTNMTTEGWDYFKSLVAADVKLYDADTAFLNVFRGLYVKPASSSAIYTLSLEDTYMTVHTHNYKSKEDLSDLNRKDTIAVSYSFADDPNYYYPTSINIIKHDYAGSVVGATQDTLTTPSFDVVYFESMLGIRPKIKFKDEFMTDIEALKTVDGIKYKDIVINKAELIVQSKNVENMNNLDYINLAPARLGSYLNFAKYTPIADYYYTYEQQGYSIPYGGYYNRSKQHYSMDISVFVQRMIRDKTAPRAFTFGPTPDITSIYGTSRVALKGFNADENESIKVKLTYTLIR